jgi:hypothetical protein
MMYGKEITRVIVDEIYMKVEPWFYPRYNGPDPVYRCRRSEDWFEVSQWLRANNAEYCLLSWISAAGYVFVVESRQAWFALRWA